MPLSYLNQNQIKFLTPKEKVVLEKILQGGTNKTIARELNLSPETVKSHVKNILHKCNVSSRVQLLSKIVQEMNQ
ncbi:MAG: hypothetical protein APF84_09670 [Gracilibacter sp. BRH_c7a]|nr:MAG: hypothetical protein APF84_09670 [Gracilibacter sp. BRH_c7a]